MATAIAFISVAASADNIAVETVAGKRLEDASYVLRPVFEELGGRGYKSSAVQVNAILSSRVSRPSEVWGTAELRALRADIEAGYRKWLTGEFEAAAAALEKALVTLYERPATVAETPSVRDSVHRALVGISLANHRLGNTEDSHAAMARVIREFPDREFSRRTYGPEAVAIYSKVTKALSKQAKATLTVTVNDPSAVVFVNERFTAIGGTSQELYPGTYRIYVQRGRERGRVHLVHLKAGQARTFKVDWAFDRALTSFSGAVGLAFSDATDRDKHSVGYARRLGAGAKADRVVLVSLGSYKGKSAVRGRVVEASTGQVLRAGFIIADPTPRAAELKALARFLADGEMTSGVMAEVGGPVAVGNDSPRTSSGALPWVVGGIGVAAAATGAVLIAFHGYELCPERDTQACEEVLSSKTAGMITLGAGGAAMIGAGVMWWVDGDEPTATVSIAPTQGGAVFGLSGNF